ncbi:MAG TPA: ATP-binding protein, partial [Dehalococcoidia bacterium]|nr:ATP-binding protein [Dehalococcoidia bacterium]
SEAGARLVAVPDADAALLAVARLLVPACAELVAVDLTQGALRRRALYQVAAPDVESARVMVTDAGEPEPSDAVGAVIAQGQSRVLTQVSIADLIGRAAHVPSPAKEGTAVIVPLAGMAGVLGAISYVRTGPERAYALDDLALFEALARLLTLAIENVRLRQADEVVRRVADRATQRADRLQWVTAELAGALTPDQVAAVVVDQSVAALGAAAGSLALVDPDRRGLTVLRAVGYPEEDLAAWRRFPIEAPVPIAEAVRTGRAVWIEMVTDWAACYPDLPAMSGHDFRGSGVAVPLINDGLVIGAIGLSFATGRKFSAEARSFVDALAHHSTLALERARLYYEAREAARARDEFLMAAAHELKTPITNLRGYAQFLIRRLRQSGRLDPDQVHQALRVFDEQSAKLTRLITRLLDVSRLDAGRLAPDRQPTNLSALVERTVASQRPFAPVHDLIARVAPDVRACIDPFRIEQVLNNLIENAVRYSPQGGPIEVELVRPDPATARLTVRDHGIGIAPENRSGIFERFYQGHAGSYLAGIGLGLYVCRQIVDLHGGTIAVEFPADGGTRFTVDLPIGD